MTRCAGHDGRGDLARPSPSSGVAPIPASSGKTVRPRLSRGGNRQANSALYRVMVTRIAHDQATRDYVARFLAEGKTMGEIGRILKRYIAREVYKHLPRHAS